MPLQVSNRTPYVPPVSRADKEKGKTEKAGKSEETAKSDDKARIEDRSRSEDKPKTEEIARSEDKPKSEDKAKSEDRAKTESADAPPNGRGEASAKAAIETDGYKGVRIVGRAPDGSWRARALRGRTEIGLTVDARGNVSQD